MSSNDFTGKDTLPLELRRRREGADRRVPLQDGRRDPLDPHPFHSTVDAADAARAHLIRCGLWSELVASTIAASLVAA